MKVRVTHKWIPWCSLFAITLSFGQVPGAGSLQKNIENTLRQTPLPINDAPQLSAVSEAKVLSGITFKLVKVIYTGNTLLTNAHIDSLIAPYLSKNLGFDQLQTLANSIEKAYQKSGAIARVVIPEQTIQGEILRITIEESNWGQVRVEGNTLRISSEQIRQTIDAAQLGGELVNLQSVQRGVLLASDLPGVKVNAIFSQSSEALTTDLIAVVSDTSLYVGNFTVDNTGPVSIGANRFVGNLGINSPLGVGDLISLTYLWSEGSNYERIGYTLPVANSGLRAGVNASHMSYKLIAAQFEGLGATGASTSQGVEATYPVIRSHAINLYLGLNTDYRVFSNSNGSSGVVSLYSVMDYSASLFLRTLDTLGGSGINNLNVVVTDGSTDLAGSPNQATIAASSHAQGSFTKTRYSFNRTQDFDHPALSVYASLSGQATGSNLDSSEMFYLGGVNGVRAYPANEGAGSQGELVTFEIKRILDPITNLTLFYDYGHIQVNPNDAYALAGDMNSYSQKGAGLSVGIKPLPNVDLKAIWAKRLGTDSNLTSSGTYQNGTSGSAQVWLTAGIGF